MCPWKSQNDSQLGSFGWNKLNAHSLGQNYTRVLDCFNNSKSLPCSGTTFSTPRIRSPTASVGPSSAWSAAWPPATSCSSSRSGKESPAPARWPTSRPSFPTSCSWRFSLEASLFRARSTASCSTSRRSGGSCWTSTWVAYAVMSCSFCSLPLAITRWVRSTIKQLFHGLSTHT